MNSKQQVIGIDGCRAGWCLIGLENNDYFFELHAQLHSIFTQHPQAILFLIDMPIGLASKGELRVLEKLARQELSPEFGSSIFTPPCSEVLKAKSYEEAKMINLKITGKSLSIQSWNLVAKMRELDHFIRQHSSLHHRIFESHPEINFKNLNKGKALQHRKNTPNKQGIEERLHILSSYDASLPDYFLKFHTVYPKTKVKDDDLLDAFSLCLTAYLGANNQLKIIQSPVLNQPRFFPNRLATYVPSNHND